MSRRSSITATFGSEMFDSISNNMDSVITVSDNIEIIKQLMDMPGFEDLLADVRETLDFTNIIVESGAEANWDSVNKVLTVPTVKGDKGDDLTMTSVVDNGDDTFTWSFSDGTTFTTPDLRGHRGIQGEKGDSLTLDNVEHVGDSIFKWSFSDGTVFTTPRLRGHKGDKGDTGLRGPQGERGISVHHMKGTSTTDPHGDFGTFGERDTYTFYGDADEKHVLGWFTVMNGLSSLEEFEGVGVMARKRYDTNNSGVVDDSEALGGKSLEQIEEERDDLLDLKLDKAGGTIENDLTVQGNLYVNGTETIVNTETLVVKDNEIVINAGEPGNGVTKGTAGIRADRGTEPDYLLQFDETDDSFKIGEESNLQKVATREDDPLDTGVAVWDSTSSKFNTTRDLSIDSLNTTGQVNNRDMVVDGEKLDSVEEGATADQTAEEIEALYESNPDTKKYTDLEKQFVDVATTLDTVATTLPTAINEVHLEVGSIVDGTTDIAFDNAGTRIAAVTLESAVKEIDSKVGDAELLSTVVATVIDSVNEVHTELDLVEGRVTTAEDTLSTHISSDGSDHAFIDQDVTTTASPTFANVNTEGLVDGRDISVDGAKLDTIESGAQANAVTSVNNRAGDVKGLVENTDKRLSDSREWITETVSQEEAEAGTAATRSAWTAQRVRQAIAAWWLGVTSTLGQTLVGRTTAAEMREDLELGTAATRNVGTSDGQVPEFVSGGEGLGGFGYGRVGTSVGRYADVNDVPKRTGFYLLTDGHPNSTNNKAPLAGFYDTAILRTLRQSTNDFVDVYLPYHQYSNGMVIAPHTSSGYAPQRIVTDSVNICTSTGNSTIYPMSQKAVTDALETRADTTTQVIAGTGLSGGGDLTANITLSVNYGTEEGTAAQGNDSRITGAMQKSDNLSDLADVAIARTNLGLGTVEEGAQVNIPTNLSYTAATRVLASSTGEDVTLPQATALTDGLMIASDKDKLDGIEADAKDDQTASEVPVVSTGNLKSTNVQSALEELQLDVDTINDGLETKVDKVVGQGLSDSNYTHTEKDKLDGIALEATKNRADSANADKEHTHTTAEVTGLDDALLTKFDKTSVVQSTGQSAEKVMSQKAVTDIIANIPSVPKTAAYTVVAADKGKSIDTTSNVTIRASVFTVGDVLVVTNTSATDSSILAASGVTIRLAGSTKTGTLTLAGYGVATLRMVTSNVWFASGAGLK